MEDVVAVRVTLESGESRYFLTWGRIQHAVDPDELEAIVLKNCGGYELGSKGMSARLCDTLQEARDQPYFFEAIFEFGQTKIPIDDGYQKWRKSIDKQMREGKHLYYLGCS